MKLRKSMHLIEQNSEKELHVDAVMSGHLTWQGKATKTNIELSCKNVSVLKICHFSDVLPIKTKTEQVVCQ